MARCALAVTIGDPGGHFLPGLRRTAPALQQTFVGGGASITSNTHPQVVRFVEEELGWRVNLAAPDGRVGLHRRSALQLALSREADAVIYSDLDHMLRWIEASPAEVVAIAADDRAEFLVVGRSAAAMSASPARLRETEQIVNHIYKLMTGFAWDVMFAVRRLTAVAAADVIAGCVEDSIANDVEWPLFATSRAYNVGYFESDHLHYRVREDFDTAADNHDGDPAKWIARVAIANLHAQVLKRFLPSG